MKKQQKRERNFLNTTFEYTLLPICTYYFKGAKDLDPRKVKGGCAQQVVEITKKLR